MAMVDDETFNVIVKAMDAFSCKFLKYMADDHPGNLITCPVSTNLAIAMAGAGSRRDTEVQFRNLLYILCPKNLGIAHPGYQRLIDNLNDINEVKFYYASKVYLTSRYFVRPSYNAALRNRFQCELGTADYRNPEVAANTINTWVQETTRGRVRDIISADQITVDTTMILVSAACLAAEWQDTFKIENTKHKPFHVYDYDTRSVPMMSRRGEYKYAELPDLKAKFIEIPYKGKELSMIVIVPNEIGGLSELVETLNGRSIISILEHGQVGDVELCLPKFKIGSDMLINNVLQSMGLRNPFQIPTADFVGICDADLKINKVLMKTFIEVNEQGSETIVNAGNVPQGKPRKYYAHNPYFFHVDRPSYFMICHNSIPAVLLSGLFKVPPLPL